MMKNKDIENMKDISIEDMFVLVSVDTSNISQKIKDEYGLDDDIQMLWRSDVDKLIADGELNYNDIIYGDTDFDDVGYEEFLHELVKDANHYLVYLPHSTWRGSSGCGIVNSLEKAFYRDYDCTQYVRGISKGNKAVLLKEHHHDVPTGHHALIIALTEKEYNALENADFNKMQDFALKYMYLENNKRELLKTIVNI